MKAGAIDYITKPVDMGEMVARVAAMLALAQRLRSSTCAGQTHLQHRAGRRADDATQM